MIDSLTMSTTIESRGSVTFVSTPPATHSPTVYTQSSQLSNTSYTKCFNTLHLAGVNFDDTKMKGDYPIRFSVANHGVVVADVLVACGSKYVNVKLGQRRIDHLKTENSEEFQDLKTLRKDFDIQTGRQSVNSI